MSQVPRLQHHPQLQCWGPHPVAPFPCGRGTTRARNIGKTPQDPRSHPNCCPHPHRPLPAPPCAPSRSSVAPLAFPPLPRDIFPAWAESTFPKNASGRAQRAGKASNVPKGLQEPGAPSPSPRPAVPRGGSSAHTHPLPQAPRLASSVPPAGSRSQPSATGFPQKPAPGSWQRRTAGTSDLSWSCWRVWRRR